MSATLTKTDFQSDQETRWCPGCGDYAVLSAVQQFMPELGIPPERIVFMTGAATAEEMDSLSKTVGNPVLEKPVELEQIQALVSEKR